MLLIETALAILAVLLSIICPTLGARWFERIESGFSRLANRRGLSVLVIGLSTLILRVAVLPVEPIPQASVHDEFAYLLQADTFAHGRLTNPTPAMWEHFETFHVIFQPTYCAKFFPGQGLFLALGQVVFGHPFWGVWLTSGLMCAAITWMLQGWFSPGWAFLGGSIAMLRFGVFGYWADSYWGGNVAAIGGALVLGALPRIKSGTRWQDAALMGVGLALLANSRPWEGLGLSLPIAVILFAWMLGKNRPPSAVSLRRVVLPLALVLGLTGVWLGYYCWRTTGHPLSTPYEIYEHTYGASPYMIWQHARSEPSYGHAIIRKMYLNDAMGAYRNFWTPTAQIMRIYSVSVFFLGPILMVPFGLLLFALPYGFSFRDIRPTTLALLSVVFVFTAGTEMAYYYNVHYSAPVTCVIIALLLIALQSLRAWNNAGLFITRAIPLACVIALAIRAGAAPLHVRATQSNTYYWDEFFELHPKGWFPRAAIQSDLKNISGNHLVFVRYNPKDDPFPDWVFNQADIEHSRIIWARDMGPYKEPGTTRPIIKIVSRGSSSLTKNRPNSLLIRPECRTR